MLNSKNTCAQSNIEPCVVTILGTSKSQFPIRKTFSYSKIDLNSSYTLNMSELHLQNLLNNDQDDNQTTVTVTVIHEDPRLSFFRCFGTISLFSCFPQAFSSHCSELDSVPDYIN